MLWRALQHVQKGFYVDVGAQSPESDSVTKAFSLMAWRGINVEPHPTYFEQLCKLRPDDINLNVALGEQPGSVTMNLVENSGLSTADEAIAAQHATAGLPIQRHQVAMLTLAQVWRQHVPEDQPVHFLKVDVEGFERAVLAGHDWQRNRPWIVLVEATLPNSQVEAFEDWEPILLAADYLFAYADGLNRFYVAKEHGGLMPAFKYPPNVFDGFSTALEQALKERATSMESHLGAVESNAASQVSSLSEQLAVLERHLQESLRRIECAEVSAIQAREREMRLRDEMDTESATLETEIAEYGKSIANAQGRAEVAERRAEAIEQQYRAIVESPWWRLTGPARRAMTRVPGSVRRQLRRVAKAAWWTVTPWRIPARLKAIRQRRRGAAAAAGMVQVDWGSLNLYPHRTPGRPAVPSIGVLPRNVVDRAGAVLWCLDLIRSNPEVRHRFPLALSQPESSGFVDWVSGEGGARFGLSAPSCALVASVVTEDPGARVRRFYHSRPDVVKAHPDGLRSGGQADLYRWFMQFGCAEGGLSPDEVLWLFVQASETDESKRGRDG